MVELTVRLVFSLAVVLGLLLLCARLAGRRFHGRRDAVVQVVHRQPISRNASVSVVTVGGRVLVLGTTDQEVRLLTELDPRELDAHTDTDAEDSVEPALTLVADAGEVAVLPVAETLRRELDSASSESRPGRHVAPQGALAGSVLSMRTWRQAWGAVTGRAS